MGQNLSRCQGLHPENAAGKSRAEAECTGAARLFVVQSKSLLSTFHPLLTHFLMNLFIVFQGEEFKIIKKQFPLPMAPSLIHQTHEQQLSSVGVGKSERRHSLLARPAKPYQAKVSILVTKTTCFDTNFSILFTVAKPPTPRSSHRQQTPQSGCTAFQSKPIRFEPLFVTERHQK